MQELSSPRQIILGDTVTMIIWSGGKDLGGAAERADYVLAPLSAAPGPKLGYGSIAPREHRCFYPVLDRIPEAFATAIASESSDRMEHIGKRFIIVSPEMGQLSFTEMIMNTRILPLGHRCDMREMRQTHVPRRQT